MNIDGALKTGVTLPQLAVLPRLAAPTATTATAALAVLLLLCFAWDAPSIVLFGTIPLSNEVATQGGDAGRQACFVLLLLAVAAAGWRVRGSRFLLQVPLVFAPILAWCWLSVLWSIDPAVAVRRIAFTTIVILSAGYIVALLPARRVIAVLTFTFAAILLADWVAVLVAPLAVHQPGELDASLVGNWRGIHDHKNEAGAFCALAIIVFVHGSLKARSYLAGPSLIILAAAFLYETHSKTAEAFVCVALLAGCAAQLSYRHRTIRRIMLWGVPLLAIIALPFGDSLLSAATDVLDDPASLTGRVQIWPALIQFAAEHPLLGSGYGSFWAIGDASPIYQYGAGWVAAIDHSHNGYLELLVHTGVIGLCIGAVSLMVLPMRDLLTRPLKSGAPRELLCSLLVFGFLHDLLETSLLNRANPTWAVITVAYCLLSRHAERPSRVALARQAPAPNPGLASVVVGGIKVGVLTRSEWAQHVVTLCRRCRSLGSRPQLVFAANGQVLTLAATDPSFRAMFEQADAVTADGQPLVWASRFTRNPLPERAATTDLFHDVARAASQAGLSFFLLGSTECNIAIAESRIRAAYPDLRIAGVRNGYFGPGQACEIAEAIAAARPDVLWVGLGIRKQAEFVTDNLNALQGVGCIITCGGLFDYFTPGVKRAPAWMQDHALEWLFRAWQDPRKYVWRYVVTNPAAAFLLLTRTRSL